MRKLFLFTLIITILLAAFALPVLAQDASEPDTGAIVVPFGSTDVNPAVSNQLAAIATSLFTLLWNAAYLPFAAPMVTVLVALSKRLPLKVSSPIWAFMWTIVLWLGYLFATQIGYVDQFQSSVTGLATLGATFLGITLTPAAASALHNYASKNNVAVIGYSKTASNNPSLDMNTLIMNAVTTALANALADGHSPEGEKVILSEAPAS